MTKVYNYDRQTGEHLSDSDARLDPIDERPLVPGFATLEKPPAAGANEVAVFVDGAWSVVIDKRGHKYWKADKSEHVINKLGDDLPGDALAAMPLPTDDELKAAATDDAISFASRARASVAEHADQYKIAGWTLKAQRLQRFANNTESATDISSLQIEIDKRKKGESQADLLAKQTAKASRLSDAVSIIDGAESAMLDAIESTPHGDILTALIETEKSAALADLAAL